jgi:hypothetical protein
VTGCKISVTNAVFWNVMVGLVRTDVSEKRIASIFKVETLRERRKVLEVCKRLTRPHGVTFQKTVSIVTAVKTSNPTKISVFTFGIRVQSFIKVSSPLFCHSSSSTVTGNGSRQSLAVRRRAQWPSPPLPYNGYREGGVLSSRRNAGAGK